MARKKRPSVTRRLARWCWKFLLVLWILTFVQVLALRFVNPPFTAMMAWNRIWNKNNIRHNLSHRSWRTLREFSPHLRKAVLAGEDQRFLSHHGFDFAELTHAVKDLVFKKSYRGASTITMQAARTVFLWPGRSWLRKLAEAYYTVLIEISWSKQRILEIYLNMVDWGSGIMGAEAASRKYFHVPASGVSRSQAALLVAVLPSPHRWSPTNPSARVLKRQKRILKDMDKMPLVN